MKKKDGYEFYLVIGTRKATGVGYVCDCGPIRFPTMDALLDHVEDVHGVFIERGE